jgi:hypothetical protein
LNNPRSPILISDANLDLFKAPLSHRRKAMTYEMPFRHKKPCRQ